MNKNWYIKVVDFEFNQDNPKVWDITAHNQTDQVELFNLLKDLIDNSGFNMEIMKNSDYNG